MKTLVVLAAALLALAPRAVLAHCDSLDGPVVKDARVALESKDVTPVLKWVRASEEPAIREAFREAVAVRALGGEARALADRSFFETLVRIHRAGEGAGYTGLKPAGKVAPPIAAADKSLETGKLQEVGQLISKRMEEGLHRNFEAMMKKQKYSPNDVAAGRAFASAYVEYTHYVERLYDAAETLAPEHVDKKAPGLAHTH